MSAEAGVSAEAVLTVDGAGPYAVSLPSFDGPLDLLLHLIRREELDIFDIPIARLTAAYLSHLDLLRVLHIEPASEFLVMAATLLQIKSRLLLPRPAALDDVGEGSEDPRDALAAQLLEYQRFQEAAQGLATRVRIGWDSFLRPLAVERPAASEDDPLAGHDAYRLAEAFRRLAAQGHYEAPHEIYVERISISERIAQIADLLAERPRLAFDALCAGQRSREELITTFLALLEMARLKLISTEQRDRLGPLWIEARAGAIGALGEEAAGTLDLG